MARNDGIDRTSVRNLAVSDKAVGNTQQHNEREKDSYRNPDIIPQRTAWNVHFKKPTASYTDLFAQLETAGTISTRGLKPDATHYCELVFDVNSAYFDNHGGYEFAKQFYEDAYQAAVQIVGGEQYILSAVMHADEINRAMTEALGREVYHYHLHVVYVPVVEKQILWSKRCKDKALVGTVKETVMQVSRSKKWASKPLLDDAGKPVLQKSGKPVLKKSYSVLQDDFFHYMRNAGYTDVERGERGSTEEHLTVTQFKVQREQERLDTLTAQIDQKEQHLTQTNKTLSKTEKELAAVQKKATLTKEALIHARDLDYIGKRTFLGNYSLTEEEFSKLKKQADHGYMMDVENRRLKEELSTAKKEAVRWSQQVPRPVVRRETLSGCSPPCARTGARLSGKDSCSQAGAHHECAAEKPQAWAGYGTLIFGGYHLNKKKKSNKSGYPDEAIKTLARCFYPSMVEFFNSEEGQREYEEWLKEQEALQALPVAA